MPKVGDSLDIWLDNARNVCMTFCWIPPGEFRMGSRYEYPDEQPVHRVEFEQGFWLGRTPVTQRQYALCFPDHDNGFPNKPNHPAESMTWNDARQFCDWLTEERLPTSESSKCIADLPTEAQWEYGCRAGTETDYYTGDGEQALARAGWYSGNANGRTHEVWQPGREESDFKIPNAFGLFDMHGNVDEWCRDVYVEHAYRHGAARYGHVEPPGVDAPEGDNGPRVIRGGAWDCHPRDCRSAFRDWSHPGIRYHVRGFRVGLFPGPSCPGAEPG